MLPKINILVPMKYILICFAILIVQTQLVAQSTVFKSGEVTFNFIAHDVQGTVSGFTDLSAVDWDNPEKSTLAGKVQTETLDTGNFLRDWSIKKSKYFNVSDYPTIAFKSTAITTKGTTWLVKGILTLKGIEKTVDIVFEKIGNTLEGTTTLYTSDFDITILKKGRESNKVLVTFLLAS